MSVPDVTPDADENSTSSLPSAAIGSGPIAPLSGGSGRRPWHFTVRGICALVLLAIVALVVIAWMASRSTPSWYRPLNPTDNVVLDQADVAQRKLAFDLHNALQRVPLGEQTWTITQDEVNSLLAIQFAPPLNPDGSRAEDPEAAKQPASSPFVRFTNGKVTLAARYKKLPASTPEGGVVSVVFSIQTDATDPKKPTALIALDSVWAGNLPVPNSIVEQRLHGMIPSLESAAGQALTYQAGVKDPSVLKPQIDAAVEGIVEGKPFPLTFNYDRRQIVVKEIVVEDGRLTIRFVPPTPAVVAPR